jgi:thiol-disulfide isomerase/thioredoxin
MSAKSRAQRRRSGRQRSGRRRQSIPTSWIIAGAIAAAFIVAIAIGVASSGSDGDDTPRGDETRPVEIAGAPLVQYTGQPVADDPGVGQTAPTVAGTDFDRRRVEIAQNGRPKAIAFVAHWCPHCRAEMPRLESWLADNELPPNLDLLIVPTATDPSRENYPPSTWLREAGLGSVPTLVDSAQSGAFLAFGAGSFPYWVYLDARGNVVARTSGEYPDDPGVYTTIFDAVANGEPFPSID